MELIYIWMGRNGLDYNTFTSRVEPASVHEVYTAVYNQCYNRVCYHVLVF